MGRVKVLENQAQSYKDKESYYLVGSSYSDGVNGSNCRNEDYKEPMLDRHW